MTVIPCLKNAALVLLVLMLSSCGGDSETESTNIHTSGVYAAYSLQANGTGTTEISASLYVGAPRVIGNNVVLELQPEDQLVATVNGVDYQLSKVVAYGDFSYRTTVPTDMGGTTFTIALLRDTEVDAPNSQLDLPFAPEFVLPAANTALNFGDTLDITWQPANPGGRDILATYQTNCGSRLGIGADSFPDTGAATVTINSRLLGDANFGMNPGVNCTLTITLDRSVSGEVDPAFGEGGEFRASQERTRAITVRL
ncbi:hypothetical protein NBRC116494_27590 [Aurantivibrio plasticivorans]